MVQVVGSLLAALSKSQQSPTAPVATAPQLAGAGSTATSPVPQGTPVLDDPQVRHSVAGTGLLWHAPKLSFYG